MSQQITSFTQIIAWQKAHQLVLKIYLITKTFPRHEEWGLTSQMRRCSVSVPSNLAEGFKRKNQKDSAHFYNISEGSLEELKYQTFLAKDLGYLDPLSYEKIVPLLEETSKLLCSWKKSQKY